MDFCLYALLMIFGLGRPTREPLDQAKSVALHSRIPCDGQTAPEDDVSVRATFGQGDWAREFLVSRYQKDACEVDLKIKCLHHEKAGWRDVWTAGSDHSSTNGMVSLGSCYAWGSKEPAQYVVTGWYKEGGAGSKVEWRQAAIQQVASRPGVFEFSDPKGGTARLEIDQR